MVGAFYGVMAILAVWALFAIACELDEISGALRRLNDE